jgi:hypothetical protein
MQGFTYYDELTRSFTREEIGQGLRDRYLISKELPPKLVALVRKLAAVEGNRFRSRTLIGKLDAIEGKYLSRYTPPAEPRGVGPSDDDWSLCT